MVSVLPRAARDVYGQPTNINRFVFPEVHPSNQDVTGTIILVNRLIKVAVAPLLFRARKLISNGLLGELLKAVNYLLIPSLRNAISSFLADRIYSTVEGVFTPETRAELMIIPLQEKLQERGFGEFPDELLFHILKHVYLKKMGVGEKTVADLIGSEGQPDTEKDLYINLVRMDKKNLTSLEGLNLVIIKNFVENLILKDNYIIGNNLDIDFPKHPFRDWNALTRLRLESNQLQQIPPSLFDDLSPLVSLHLEFNQLQDLPEGIFRKLSKLEILNVSYNFLPGTKEDFIRRHNLESVWIFFDPQLS
jgi:hypothetical protein